ncbi:MAG: Tn3 family transposase, partial [Candidatus Nanopelagicales bacterium]
QLCTLPWLGFVPVDVASAPPVAVARLAARLGVDPVVLVGYGKREQTRTDHLRLVVDHLGWQPVPTGGPELAELERFLLARAMERDSAKVLFGLACEFLIAARTVRPGAVTLMQLVGAARAAASSLTHQKVAHLLTEGFRADLDGLLVFDAELGMTRLAWLTRPAVEATANSVKAQLDKLLFARSLGAHVLDLSMLAGERRRSLAGIGRRASNQTLVRREPGVRYPILLCVLAQAAVDLLDEVVALFDQAVSARESRAKTKTEQALADRARTGEDRQQLLEVVLGVLADESIPHEAVGGLLRDQLGRQNLADTQAEVWVDLPRGHGRLRALAGSYPYLRQFTPDVLAAIDFQGGPGMGQLMDAVSVLGDLNRTGRRKVRGGAPAGFVPRRYAGYLAQARRSGDDVGYRHYWELCVLLGLRDGLRSGDVHVPGSRRYADSGSYLIPPTRWSPRRDEFCALVGKPADPGAAISQGREDLHAALADLDRVLADTGPDDAGQVRLDAHGDLVIPPLAAEDIPPAAAAVKEELTGLLPNVAIAAVLIELDHRTGFLSAFTHASTGKPPSDAETKRNVLAVLIAAATHLGLVKMAQACSVAYDVLAWTQEWFVREDTLRAANTVIVNHHHRLDLAGVFGGGTMSSSDGQRFPARGKSSTARAMNIHFADQGLSTYTHVSDQHSTYGTKVLVPTAREAHYVLDDLLGNTTDLPISQHATDTHGVTLVNFALFDLVGKALTPRIRDLGKITLCRDDTKKATAARYPNAGPLLGTRLNEDLIADCWPDLLRMAGSPKYGEATASLVVGKWSGASRQNTLAAGLKEWGMLRRTVHAARYLSDPPYRRGISRQLNKGESLHSLRRDLHYANRGTIAKVQLTQQTEHAWCLTVLTNAVVTWTTEYYALAVARLRSQGRDIPDDLLTHISPAHSQNVNYFGIITVDVEAELAKLDTNGHRPLRT